ncbi:MAG TPA: hypothetical protein DCX07_14615 [Phycisphaerales bacterium]|nr:hypothetical protein [Phycisphaerales bacterium]
MKQGILPLVAPGASDIDGLYSVFNDGRTVTWFCGAHPMRVHPASDHASQRSMLAFMNVHCGVKQGRLAKLFRVHPNTVLAAVGRYRQKGDAGFFEPTAVRGPAVMTPEVMAECRRLLNEGRSRAEVAEAVGVGKYNIDKAIQKGKLPESSSVVKRRSVVVPDAPLGSTSSERAAADVAAASELGMACTRVEERVMAACGLLGEASTRFETCCDVPHGGVLCALPALGGNGLFEHLGKLGKLPDGYYGLVHVFVLLAFMALLRVKTVEALRRDAPGEMGKLVGLDRIPEVRCLRAKVGFLARDAVAVGIWANTLSREWMQNDPDLAGTLYVDGHVRVYHGSKTNLPRRYVARQRLCLRGVTDYWVNDREGNPFFYIDRPVDDGLLSVLRSEIVPRLLVDVPCRPSAAELAADPLRLCFRLVFDRAGCSPVFIKEMWQEHRIACLTYKKSPGDDWPEEEFHTVEARLANGETIAMELAERGVWFGNDRDGFWCREFRRLRRGKHGNHQTAIMGSDYHSPAHEIAPAMFARWGQENFFRYMLQEFGLDLMPEHDTEVFPCSIPVPNPAWKALDAECRSLRGKIAAVKAKLGNKALELDDLEPGPMEAWIEKQDALFIDAADLEQKLNTARSSRRALPTHVPFDQLPPEYQFERLAPTRKLLLDTVRLIAYRAETALANLARPAMATPEEARAIVKAIFQTTADLHPDPNRRTLRVLLHPLAEPRLNRTVEAILGHLNDAEFTYPGTDLRMVYELISADAHAQ